MAQDVITRFEHKHTQRTTASCWGYRQHGWVWRASPAAALGGFSQPSASRAQPRDFRVFQCSCPWGNPGDWTETSHLPKLPLDKPRSRRAFVWNVPLVPGARLCRRCSSSSSRARPPTRRSPPNPATSAGAHLGRSVQPADSGLAWREAVLRCGSNTQYNKLRQLKTRKEK